MTRPSPPGPVERWRRRTGLRRGPLSLRRQLLLVLVTLSLPLLLVAPAANLLLLDIEDDHTRSQGRVQVAAQLSDLQARVAALTSSLTERGLLEGDTAALTTLLRNTQSVEQGFRVLRPQIPGSGGVAVDEAYTEWRALVSTLIALPPRFPELLRDGRQLRLALGDLGPRLLRIAQVLNAAAADNAAALRVEVDRAHGDQRQQLRVVLGLALVGLLDAVCCALSLHRRISVPLLALQHAVHRFGNDDGEEQPRLVADRTPELGALAEAFNQLTDRLMHVLTARDELPPAVLYCDLDGFKQVNDSLGHAAGDALLVTVAQRLTEHLRPRDTAARLGGDEFAVLLEQVTPAEALATGQRLLAAVTAPVVVDGVEVVPLISIGVACADPGSRGVEGAEELLRDADAAMYQAKHRRGAHPGVVVFDAVLAGDLLARLELKSDLQRALSAGQFAVQYQPTMDLPTGRMTGVEALVRWHHPERGLVTPDEFIPLAEESGLIVPLGLWVLETACAQMRHWQAEHPELGLHLNVNLSGRQLEQADLVRDVAAVLQATGYAASALTLELTESVLVDRSEDVLERLHGLKALGVKLAIDDFGTGYSSLSYLQRLPIDVLKIDKSFVDVLAGTGAAGSGEVLAATIISMARTLGLGSVAEGIEHASQAEALRLLGCETGQGYLFARPLAPVALSELLARQHVAAPALVVTA